MGVLSLEFWHLGDHYKYVYYDITPEDAGIKTMNTSIAQHPYSDLKFQMALMPFENGRDTLNFFSQCDILNYELVYFFDGQPETYRLVARYEK